MIWSYATTYKLPLIMAFNVQENAVFIHEFSEKVSHVSQFLRNGVGRYCYWRPFVTSTPLSWIVVHSEPLRLRTNVVYFRVMRRLYRRECNWLAYAWTSIHDNGQGITACDVILQHRIPRGIGIWGGGGGGGRVCPPPKKMKTRNSGEMREEFGQKLGGVEKN